MLGHYSAGFTLDTYAHVTTSMQKQAANAACASGSSCAVSIAGIAGPDGGTPEKPVGLVYIGCFVMGKVKVEKNCFQGSRAIVSAKSVEAALELLLKCLS